MAEYHLGLTIELDERSRVLIDGRALDRVQQDEDGQFFLAEFPEVRTTDLVALGRLFIDRSPQLSTDRIAIRDRHIEILRSRVDEWNRWRRQCPATRPLLFNTDLRQEALGLEHLRDADFANANLIEADLSGMCLAGANFHEANLGGAKLHGADLTYANFCRTDLYKTKAPKANLTGANLQGTQLANTDFAGATLIGCTVYGMSAWDLTLDGAVQRDLVVRYCQKVAGGNGQLEGRLTIDDLQVAQFLYMLLNNNNLGTIVDATTSRVVLILGRFTPPSAKDVLDAVRNALRDKGWVPIIFDFRPPDNRDLTETVQLVASLAKFVIADLGNAKSIPQELSHIIPNLPSVPVQPVLLASAEGFSMFEHWRRYPWVLPVFCYQDKADLIDRLQQNVITPAVAHLDWMAPQASLKAARREIDSLRRQLAESANVGRPPASSAATS